MKKTLNQSLLVVAALLASLLSHPASLRAQGSLTPPGAPAPMMKTLGQIEPRTPVDATNTPASASAEFTITQPGSYYLTTNITGVVGAPYGILIAANDVTLDLNGFLMTGLGSGSFGIVVSGGGNHQNVFIRNGTLRNWGQGVNAASGYCELDHLRVYGSASSGFYLGNQCVIRNCTALGNGATGITIGNACAVSDCLVFSNTAAGISGGSDCIISGCQAIANTYDGIDLTDHFNLSKCTANLNGGNGNGGSGFDFGNNGNIQDSIANANTAFGIVGGSDCVLSGCEANDNIAGGIDLNYNSNVTKCIADGNYFVGFETLNNGQIRDSVVNSNGSGGILAEAGCIIKGCTANWNGGFSSWAPGFIFGDNSVVMDNQAIGNSGIGLFSADENSNSRIEGNYASGNGSGIDYQTNDIVVRNVCRDNGTNYAGGATTAPVQTPSAATSPWANF